MRIHYIQYSTASSGTVTMTDTQEDIQLIHEDVLLTASLTIAFPANPVDGQRVHIASALGITSLTLTAAVGTLLSALTTLAAGGSGGYMFRLASNKWYKIH